MTTVTQFEIADKLGISRQAVGFALSRDASDHGRLRPETRQQILATARQLGYVPHRAARNLASGKTYTIILATHTSLRYAYASELIEELELALTPHGYHLNLELLHHVKDEDSIYRTFSPGHCDGVIKFDAHSFDHEHDQLVASRQRGLPVVAVHLNQRPELDSVCTDVAEEARLATAHLLEQAHRRIAYVVDAVECVSRQTRLTGYRRAFAQAGVEYDEALVIPWRADVNPRGLWAQITALSPRPTGIVCYNAELTVALLLEIRKHGVRVPEDMALVSEGDTPLHVLVDPPLTATDRNNRGVAAVVVERLLAQMRDPQTPPQQILVKPFLVERASSSKPIAPGESRETTTQNQKGAEL
jgi:LacI family transcriptional regulator